MSASDASPHSGLASNAQAFFYFESSSGDLSGDINAPTVLALNFGNNAVAGTMGAGDFDLFTFNVAPGLEITDVIVDNWDGSSGSSFVAIAAGATWPTGLGNNVSAGALTDFALFNAADIGNGIFGNVPFGAGDYTVLVQDTAGEHDYGLNFVVGTAAPVPVPAALPLLASGLLGVAWRRRSA